MGILIFQFLYWRRFIITFPTDQANNFDVSIIYCTCGPFSTRMTHHYRVLSHVLGFRQVATAH